MKNFKKLISALLACTMICAVSVTSFAFSKDAGYYTVEFKVQDAAGNVITEAAAGSEVYVATYIYETANPNASIVIAANKSAELVYELDIPVGFMANEASYEGAEFTDIDNVVAGAAEGTATITDFSADAGIYAIENTANITGGITLSSDVAVLKNKVTLSENLGTYELMTFDETFMFSDGSVYAGGCEIAVTEFEIVAKSVQPPVEEGPKATAGTTTTDGKITEYTFEGTDAIEKVLLFNESVAGTAITETTRFKVTSGTRTQIFGGDIWAKLGAEGAGSVTAANVSFGLIVDADASAADFTFEIVK